MAPFDRSLVGGEPRLDDGAENRGAVSAVQAAQRRGQSEGAEMIRQLRIRDLGDPDKELNGGAQDDRKEVGSIVGGMNSLPK